MIQYNILILGAGGTGGNFAKEFARFMAANIPSTRIRTILIDGDVVEDKNRERQPFLAEDVQENKALILSQAIKEVFDLGEHWRAYPHYIDKGDTLLSLLQRLEERDNWNETTYLPILVGCVDNHRARQCLEEAFQHLDSCIYIDSANEFSVGEVVCGIKLEGKVLAPPRSFYFPEVLTNQGKRASEKSCGEVNLESPQHLATNLFAATLLLSMVVQIISEQRLPGGITYFDRSTYFSRFHPYQEGGTQ